MPDTWVFALLLVVCLLAATVVIRRSHHIGCLQAYLKPVTDDGLVILLTCSDPSGAGVTPHGGVASRITPNPIAAGFPTRDRVWPDLSR